MLQMSSDRTTAFLLAALLVIGIGIQPSSSFAANRTGRSGADHAEGVAVAVDWGKVEQGENGTGANPGRGGFGLDPGILEDHYTTPQDTTLTLAAPGVLKNSGGLYGDALFVEAYDPYSWYGGSIRMNPDGSFSYTPPAGFAGIDTFVYLARDGGGEYDSVEVVITVAAWNTRSVSVELQSFNLGGGALNGWFMIANQSGGYDVQITDLAIEAQYKVSGGRWTYVQAEGGSCTFDPAPLFLVTDHQMVSFSECRLAEAISEGAEVRVTAKVRIFGRFEGNGKADGWFLDRRSR
jgi:hypothetical protein